MLARDPTLCEHSGSCWASVPVGTGNASRLKYICEPSWVGNAFSTWPGAYVVRDGVQAAGVGQRAGARRAVVRGLGEGPLLTQTITEPLTVGSRLRARVWNTAHARGAFVEG